MQVTDVPGDQYSPSTNYEEVRLDRLRLDPFNARLPRDQGWDLDSEVELLKLFARRYNLIELARSISDKGFTPRQAEALLAVRDQSDPEVLVVVEGNRRLATLKLLNSADLRTRVKPISAEWEKLAKLAQRWDLDLVPVVIHKHRDELHTYLGFRHITGPRPWRPEAKARYITSLFGPGDTVGDVARRIGSNHRTVRRFAEADALYTQGIQLGIEMDRVEAGFAVFYNALDREGIRTFLDLGRQVEINRLPIPRLSERGAENLSMLIDLLFGDESRGIDSVITESRELTKLANVLAEKQSRTILLTTWNLERAWRIGGGGSEELQGTLLDLYARLAEVNGQATEYADDEAIRRGVGRISRLVAEMADRYHVSSD